MTSLEAVQGWMSEVSSTMSGLGAAFAAAAPAGDFASVLDSALAVLDGPPAGPAGEVAPPAVPATGSILASTSAGPAPGQPLPALAASVTGSQVVSDAEAFLGVPYLWGGTTPAGFDCSGLVQYVYGQLGVSLPRTSEEQALTGTAVPSLAAAQPGDLVFFAGTDGTPSAPGHVGIYLGDGQMIDAPHSGAAVTIEPVGDPVSIRRVLSPAAPSPGAPASLDSAADGLVATASPATSVAEETPSSLTPLFLAAAKTYGVPSDVLEAVAKEESSFSPSAVSSAGAEGLMQLMPSTASSLGVDGFDASQAIDGAASLLSGYLKQFGSLSDALAAYNAGPNAVERYGGVPPYPQTETYVQAILDDLGESPTPAAAGAPVATAPATTTIGTTPIESQQ